MKKVSIFFIIAAAMFAMWPRSIYAQKVSGDVTFMTRGIAPIPAFGIPGAAFFGDMMATYKKTQVLADMAFEARNGDMWFSDLWYRWYPVKNFRIAANWSMSNSDYTDPNGKVIRQSQRYAEVQLYGEKPLGSLTASVIYWYMYGIGEGTIRGHFAIATLTDPVDLGHSVTLRLMPSVFYINFTGPEDGLFFTEVASLSKGKIPVSLSVQSIQPVATDIPGITTKLSCMLTYSF